MKKGNIRLLTKDELNRFEEKYSFELQNDYIVVKCNNFNRPTMHDLNKDFFLSCGGRKIIINSIVSDLWKRYFQDMSIVKLQNIVNQLTIMYQDVTLDNINKILRKESSND